MKSISLKQLKTDKESVIRDIQIMQEQLIGAQYVLRYLSLQVQKIEKGGV